MDDLEAPKLLFDLSVDSSVQDKRGMPALHMAAGRGNEDIVKALVLKNDRCAFMKDIHGRLPYPHCSSAWKDRGCLHPL